MDEEASTSTDVEVIAIPANPASATTRYDASKISLVAELKQKDSFGRQLAPVPSSIRGRYQTIADDDKSLRPLDDGTDENNLSEDDADAEEESGETDTVAKDLEAPSSTTVSPKKPPVEEPKGAAASDGDEPQVAAEGSVKRASLVATINVVTNLMKWQMKSKTQAGAKLKSMEKYKGHLEVIQRRSRQEQVDLPFPISLSIKREILPIIHNIAKEYRLALGHDHRLTQEAIAKEEQLQSELGGDGIIL